MRYIIVFVFLCICNYLSAQNPVKLSKEELKNLPKLEKVVIGNEYGIISSPEKENNFKNVSDTQVINRSNSDGKVSRTEKAIIEKVKKLPQTE